eukprot:1157677-Pelagomonas_calceolata.AAC.13
MQSVASRQKCDNLLEELERVLEASRRAQQDVPHIPAAKSRFNAVPFDIRTQVAALLLSSQCFHMRNIQGMLASS